jgi:deoxyribonuclease V
MIAYLDVDYRDPGAVAARVLFRAWTDASPASEVAVTIERVAPYEPGRFYRRELP